MLCTPLVIVIIRICILFCDCGYDTNHWIRSFRLTSVPFPPLIIVIVRILYVFYFVSIIIVDKVNDIHSVYSIQFNRLCFVPFHSFDSIRFNAWHESDPVFVSFPPLMVVIIVRMYVLRSVSLIIVDYGNTIPIRSRFAYSIRFNRLCFVPFHSFDSIRFDSIQLNSIRFNAWHESDPIFVPFPPLMVVIIVRMYVLRSISLIMVDYVNTIPIRSLYLPSNYTCSRQFVVVK